MTTGAIGLDGPAWLFCPADRPERLAAAGAKADVVVADLEDAVAPDARPAARDALRGLDLDARTTLVRVNAPGTPDLAADLEALAATGLRRVMLPKAESPEQLAALDGFEVVALCESPEGVLRASAIARASNCIGVMWGSEDLAAGLGAWGSRDEGGLRPTMRWARAVVLAAARAAGVLAIDAVDPRFADLDAVAAEAREAAFEGFDAKACIHPTQVAAVRAAFSPPAERIAWAERVLGASPDGSAAARDGAMIDEAVLRAARRILALAARGAGR